MKSKYDMYKITPIYEYM